MKPEDYVLDEWNIKVANAKEVLLEDRSLLGDRVIIDIDNYIHHLEQSVKQLSLEKQTLIASLTQIAKAESNDSADLVTESQRIANQAIKNCSA